MTTFAQHTNPSRPPRLRPAHLSDYTAIARVAAENGLITPPEREWCRLWLDNPVWPRVGADWPIGWVLDHEGVVGSIVSVPSLYRLRGRDLISANGRGWNVLPPYRAFALWLMDEYLTQVRADLFINTTVGPMATSALDELARRTPAGDWTTVTFWVTDYPTLTRRLLERRHVPLASTVGWAAAQLLRAGVALRAATWPMRESVVDVEALDGFDARFDGFWEELVRQHPDVLLGVRDRRTLAWHFEAARRQGRLWVFAASRAGALRAYAVCTIDTVGLGVRRAQLIDYQSVEDQGDPLPALIRAARARATREGVSVLEHLGSGLPKYQAFDRAAPHRRVKPCWPHYYRTNDPHLAAELASPEIWDPSLFDGDASLE